MIFLELFSTKKIVPMETVNSVVYPIRDWTRASLQKSLYNQTDSCDHEVSLQSAPCPLWSELGLEQ